MTWETNAYIPKQELTLLKVLLATLKIFVIFFLLLGGLLILVIFRCFEKPVFLQHRPLTPYITLIVCKLCIKIIGIKYQVEGNPMKLNGAIVSNHSSWLDIFSLNACQKVYFVSKSEVAKWPFIGWLARATGTIFIRRERKDSVRQRDIFQKRLQAGHRLLFFPEGTSTDGQQVIGFKSTLFAAFFDNDKIFDSYIQPVSIFYQPPVGEDKRFYGWWGHMSFAKHFVTTLGNFKQGIIKVNFLVPVRISEFQSRKELAKKLEKIIRDSHAKNLKN